MTNPRRGVALVLLADIFWACNPTTIALVQTNAVDVIYAGRFGIASIGFMLLYGVPRWRLSGKELMLGACFLIAGISYITAVRTAGVIPTTVLYFLGPLWASIFSWLFHGRQPSKVTIAALIAVIAGMYLVALGGFTKSSSIGMSLGILSGMLNALWIVFGADLSREQRHNSNTVMCLFAGVAGLLVTIARGTELQSFPPMDFGWIVLNGIATCSGLALLARGQQELNDPAEISLLLSAQVPLAVVLPIVIEIFAPAVHLVRPTPATRVLGYMLVALAPLFVIIANLYRSRTLRTTVVA